ncbi:MAG: hypothetical protein ACTSRH_18850 [Promethearchaeota archaeon]
MSKEDNNPNKIIELVSKVLISSKMYKMMGNLGEIIRASRYGALKRMKDQPDLNEFIFNLKFIKNQKKFKKKALFFNIFTDEVNNF